jgi:hypothetical protein
VRKAIKVQRESPELADKVLAGEMTVDQAEQQHQAQHEGETEAKEVAGQAETAPEQETTYLFDVGFSSEPNGDNIVYPWNSTFEAFVFGAEELAGLFFEPAKRNRAKAVEQLNCLAKLISQMSLELETKAPTSSSR